MDCSRPPSCILQLCLLGHGKDFSFGLADAKSMGGQHVTASARKLPTALPAEPKLPVLLPHSRSLSFSAEMASAGRRKQQGWLWRGKLQRG